MCILALRKPVCLFWLFFVYKVRSVFTNNTFQKCCCCFHVINLLLIQLHLRHQRSYCFSGLSLVYRDLLLLYKIINRIHKFLIKLFTFIVDLVYLPSQSGELLCLKARLWVALFVTIPGSFWLPLLSSSLYVPFLSLTLLSPLLLCCECRQQVSNSSAHLCIKRLVLHLSHILKSTCLVTTSGFL